MNLVLLLGGGLDSFPCCKIVSIRWLIHYFARGKLSLPGPYQVFRA